MNPETNTPSESPVPSPWCKRCDDEIRARARELHEQSWVIEIDDDAKIERPDDDDECVRIAAWIYLGPED